MFRKSATVRLFPTARAVRWIAAGLAIALVMAAANPAAAATLTAPTSLATGAAIPTDGGNYAPTGTGPYTYNIDNDPANTALNTRVAFDMDSYTLSNNGGTTKGVTINAASLSHGTGGTFNFVGTHGAPLTINVTGALAARSVDTHTTGAGNANAKGGPVTFSAPDGITLVDGIYTGNTGGGSGGLGGAITLTSSAGSIVIGGDLRTTSMSSANNVTLTAGNGVTLSGGINTDCINVGTGTRFAGNITVDGGAGAVGITGAISAHTSNSGGTHGNLSITSGDAITLSSQLDLTKIKTLTLTAPSVFLNGGVAGAGKSLTKTGTGTWTLSATSSYDGATTVSNGILAVNGSLTNSAVTVNGGTLRGSGSITNSVTINGGGTLAAGNSIESLATGALSLAANSTFAYELDKDAAAAVAGDLTAVTGNLTLDSGNGAILTLTELGSTGSWSVGEKLTLVSYSGTWNDGLFNYSSSTLLDDSTFTFSGAQWKFDYDDTVAGGNYTGDLTGSSFVTMTVIPEPSTLVLLGVALLALLIGAGRRRKG